MSIATPNWTGNVALGGALAAPQTLAHGGQVRGTLDLRSKYEAFLFLRLGRLGSAAPSGAIQVQIRRVGKNGGPGGVHPGASIPLSDGRRESGGQGGGQRQRREERREGVVPARAAA